MTWTIADPGLGRVESLLLTGGTAARQRTAANSIADAVRWARTRLLGAWEGPAAEDWSIRAGRLLGVLATVDAPFDRLEHSLLDYRGEVIAIAATRRHRAAGSGAGTADLVSRRTTADAIAVAAIAECTAAVAAAARDARDARLRSGSGSGSWSGGSESSRGAGADVTGGSSGGARDRLILTTGDNPTELALGGLGELAVAQLDALSVPERRALAVRLGSDPTAVAAWWASLPAAAQTRLSTRVPELVGMLDGLPATVRVAANRAVAIAQRAVNADLAADLEAQRDRVTRNLASSRGFGGGAHTTTSATVAPSGVTVTGLADRINTLRVENAYLDGVSDGSVRLYSYDRAADRLVEMVGDPETATQRLVYVPGTAAAMDGFYRGTVQELAALVGREVPGTLAFVCKDGGFPGWGLSHSPADASLARRLGESLARLHAGINAAGLADLPTTAIGHSFGLAVVTASEQSGAHYNTVVSLSGVGMNATWRPDPTTSYVDYTPEGDPIRLVRGLSLRPTGTDCTPPAEHGYPADPACDSRLGFPRAPNRENGFTVRDSGLETEPGLPGPLGITLPDPIGDFREGLDNHNRIASAGTSTLVRDELASLLRGEPIP